MDALAHGFVSVAAVLAGVLVAVEIEEPVKRTVRRWWQSLPTSGARSKEARSDKPVLVAAP